MIGASCETIQGSDGSAGLDIRAPQRRTTLQGRSVREMVTPADIVREVFPDADEAFIEHAVWSRTGFPGFFALKEGQTVRDKMREQLIEFRAALDLCPKDKRLCDHCNNFVSKGAWRCISCDWNRCFDLEDI